MAVKQVRVKLIDRPLLSGPRDKTHGYRYFKTKLLNLDKNEKYVFVVPNTLYSLIPSLRNIIKLVDKINHQFWSFSVLAIVLSLIISTLFFFQISFVRNTKEEQDKVHQVVLEEIALLHKLKHQNIVACLGATQHEAHYNLFMELMSGQWIFLSRRAVREGLPLSSSLFPETQMSSKKWQITL